MSPSIASSKSICLTLALAVLTSSSTTSATSSSMCDTCSDRSSSSFDITSSIINKHPIHLPPLSSTTDDSSSISHQSNTTFENEYNNELHNLPEELIAMIHAAQQPSPAAAPTRYPSKGVRYYATYGSESSCTSKTVENFERWEESFGSLDECCSLLFSYDYDGCMMS